MELTPSTQTLLKFGAWPNSVDIHGLTPIFYAVTSGHSECVLRLLMAKADTEVFDESGKGPLHQAALNNFDCIVALLIDFGANMQAVNVAGNTPLHVAATRNHKESAKWLLARGADRKCANKSGKTAFEVATQANCPEVAEIIQKFTDDLIGEALTVFGNWMELAVVCRGLPLSDTRLIGHGPILHGHSATSAKEPARRRCFGHCQQRTVFVVFVDWQRVQAATDDQQTTVTPVHTAAIAHDANNASDASVNPRLSDPSTTQTAFKCTSRRQRQRPRLCVS
ncbi:ankyrin repeat-containing domain protein [Entophlyctis helioformis]|nr:ankyrin repeat-containing domain protein [Entophlyctis helioformis]